MKIADVSVFPVRFETGRSYLGALPDGAAQDRYFVRAPWRSWYSAAFESLLVAIRTDDGLEGWGEALAPVGPQVPAAAVERLLAPALIGEDPRSVRPTWQRLSWLMRERGHLVGHQADALAAVDIALWDLWGKVAGQPVAALLGSAGTRTVPTYVSGLPRPDDAGRAELMSEWTGKGVRRVKLALGYGVEADLATFDAVAAVHDDLKVAIDAHWVYALPTRSAWAAVWTSGRRAGSLRRRSCPRTCAATAIWRRRWRRPWRSARRCATGTSSPTGRPGARWTWHNPTSRGPASPRRW